MPSNYSASLRIELQAPGEGLNVWGTRLNNNALTPVEAAIAGWTTVALAADTTLTSANGSADQARSAMLNFTGTGSFTVTTPAVPKIYLIRNALSGDLTITTGSGASAVVESGEINVLICDGTNWRPLGVAGESWKSYVDAQAFAALDGDLPGQTGNAGKVLSTDGSTAAWEQVSTRPDFIQAAAAADKRAVGYAYFPRG
ncbi:hypothetical protein [Phenylobacterium sp.]|uniref:hypothetical protein n=1 Tax=Phenylobacterium sp. TaxID=1871053 RepID=UPI0026361E94|nr:hypothetical protein [Phenylobacterium sp.]